MKKKHVQSPIRTYTILALYEHKAIFHVLELYSTNQIPFCQIGLRCVQSRIITALSNPAEKNSHGS